MLRLATFLACVLVLLQFAPSQAQVRPWYYPRAAAGYGGGYGGYGLGGTTVAGSQMQGMSEIIRASGEAGEAASRASINYQDAKSAYIDNSVKWQKAYLERRRTWQATAEEDRKQKAEVRDKWLATRGSGAPAPLSSSQVDFAGGKITWPIALRSEDFADQRKELEELLALQASASGGPELAAKISDAAREMTRALSAQIQKIPAYDYMPAYKFLQSLAYHARA